MKYININIEALDCKSPIIKNVTYTGTRYKFLLEWVSQGDYYFLLDNTTTMDLTMVITETVGGVVAHTEVFQFIPFSTNNYMINIMDYYPNFSGKYSITFILNLNSDLLCNTQSVPFTVPITYP